MLRVFLGRCGARRYFLLARLYFFLTLCVFAAGHAFLPDDGVAVFACRCFTYLGSMGHLLVRQVHQVLHDSRHRKFKKIWKIPVPEHLFRGQELGSCVLLVLLILMCAYEPIWRCLGEKDGGAKLFNTTCPGATKVQEAYGYLASCAMLAYCFLSLDLTVLSMRLHAFVLVCSRMLEELLLFLAAAGFLATSFALSIASLRGSESKAREAREAKETREAGGPGGLENFGLAAYRLIALALGLEQKEGLEGVTAGTVAVAAFAILVTIFLLNLLVAQLNQAYQKAHPVMQGYARLNRARIIVATVRQVSQSAWSRPLGGLGLGGICFLRDFGSGSWVLVWEYVTQATRTCPGTGKIRGKVVSLLWQQALSSSTRAIL